MASCERGGIMHPAGLAQHGRRCGYGGNAWEPLFEDGVMSTRYPGADFVEGAIWPLLRDGFFGNERMELVRFRFKEEARVKHGGAARDMPCEPSTWGIVEHAVAQEERCKPSGTSSSGVEVSILPQTRWSLRNCSKGSDDFPG